MIDYAIHTISQHFLLSISQKDLFIKESLWQKIIFFVHKSLKEDTVYCYFNVSIGTDALEAFSWSDERIQLTV